MVTMMIMLFSVLLLTTYTSAQPCIYTANNTQATLNLTALYGSIITASDGLFDWGYDPCNNQQCHYNNWHSPSPGPILSISQYSTGSAQCCPMQGLLYNVQYNPSQESFKIVYKGDKSGDSWTAAIIYWFCDSKIDDYQVIDVGSFDSYDVGGASSSDGCISPSVQLQLSSRHACIIQNQFDLKLFLKAMDLSKHYQLFVNQGFKDDDYGLISKLTNADLKELGISKMAERYRILS
eukprot:137718_1